MAGLILNRNRQAPAEDSPAFGSIAERFRRAGDHERAITLCREGLAKFPNQLSARVTLGWALLDTGRYEDARIELEQVLRRAPDNLAAIRGLAELHERAENTAPSMEGGASWHRPSDDPHPAPPPAEAARVDPPFLSEQVRAAAPPEARPAVSAFAALGHAPIAWSTEDEPPARVTPTAVAPAPALPPPPAVAPPSPEPIVTRSTVVAPADPEPVVAIHAFDGSASTVVPFEVEAAADRPLEVTLAPAPAAAAQEMLAVDVDLDATAAAWTDVPSALSDPLAAEASSFEVDADPPIVLAPPAMEEPGPDPDLAELLAAVEVGTPPEASLSLAIDPPLELSSEVGLDDLDPVLDPVALPMPAAVAPAVPTVLSLDGPVALPAVALDAPIAPALVRVEAPVVATPAPVEAPLAATAFLAESPVGATLAIEMSPAVARINAMPAEVVSIQTRAEARRAATLDRLERFLRKIEARRRELARESVA